MTKQVQRRRGTDTQHTGFTGAEGEISVNTTNKSVHVHDGSTAGGFEAARADLNNVTTANTASKLSGGTVSSLTVTSADINGGTIDGTTIGGSTPAAGSFTNVSVTGTVDGRDVATDGTKLDGIEASADVTDTANVTAAGALMDSELTDIAAVKALNQGVATTDSPSFAGITATTADINSGTIDGVTIGGASAGAGTFTTITGSGEMNIDSGTLFVDVSTNNVGIGNTSPSRNLEIGDGTETAAALALHATNTGNSTIFFRDSDDTNVGYAQYDHNGDFLRFGVNNSERMRIDSSGNVGIGRSDNLSSKATISSTVTGDFSALNLINDEPDGSADAVSLDFTLARTGGSFRDAGLIKVGKEQLYNFSSNCDSYMAFHTMDASTSYERMRIDSSGKLLCGITSDATTANAGFSIVGSAGRIEAFTASGNKIIRFYKVAGSENGSIQMNASSVSFNETSDYRLKENVVDMTDAIDRVKALKPSRFNFIGDDATVDGFLAHEAQEVVPEAVTGEKDAVDKDGNIEIQQIDKSKLVPLLTGALKEAIARIETLEAQVATLQGN